jgi:hypothetical protein
LITAKRRSDCSSVRAISMMRLDAGTVPAKSVEPFSGFITDRAVRIRARGASRVKSET